MCNGLYNAGLLCVLAHVTGQKPNAVKDSACKSGVSFTDGWRFPNMERTPRALQPRPLRAATQVSGQQWHACSYIGRAGRLAGSGVSGLSAGVRWVEYLIETSYRTCLELFDVRGTFPHSKHETLTRIIYRHVSTYMCFEGTCYTWAQALSWETHHSDLGRKTGQLSVKVEAVWIREVLRPNNNVDRRPVEFLCVVNISSGRVEMRQSGRDWNVVVKKMVVCLFTGGLK